jgi:hypothetical protein
MLKLTEGQFIVNKAGIRSREEDVAIHLVFKVLVKMVGAFERDHRRDVITTSRDALCRRNKFLILWIIDICHCISLRNNNQQAINYPNYTSCLIKVIYILVENPLLLPTPFELCKMILYVLLLMCCSSFC